MRLQAQGAHMSRYTVIVRGSDEGFTAEFATREIELESEGSTISEALVNLAQELALHEEQQEATAEDGEVAKYRYMS
jgi:hypothetical protein